MDKVDLQNSQILNGERRDFSIQTTKKRKSDHMRSFRGPLFDNIDSPYFGMRGLHKSSSSTTEGGELVEFDVFEREGYDNIMQAVAMNSPANSTVRGEASDPEVFAKCLRDTLDIAGCMTPEWYVIFLLQNCRELPSSYLGFPLIVTR